MTRSRIYPRSVLQACFVAVLAGGCTDDGHPAPAALEPSGESSDAEALHGGQSGTEGGSDFICYPAPAPRTVTEDEVLPIFGFTPSAMATGLAAESLPGQWLAAGQSELSVELDVTEGVRELTTASRDGVLCDSTLEVVLIVRTSDGSVDARVPARVTRGDFRVNVDATLPGLPADLLGPADANDVTLTRAILEEAGLGPTGGGTTLRVALIPGSQMTHAGLYEEGLPVGVWLSDAASLP